MQSFVRLIILYGTTTIHSFIYVGIGIYKFYMEKVHYNMYQCRLILFVLFLTE